jgi:hypothetical protein
MQESSVRGVVVAFLTVGFNLVVVCACIFVYALYYTPGNPVRPKLIGIDIIGAIGMFIGIAQILYLAPVLYLATRSHQWNLVKGVVLGAVVTALLNLIVLSTLVFHTKDTDQPNEKSISKEIIFRHVGRDRFEHRHQL